MTEPWVLGLDEKARPATLRRVMSYLAAYALAFHQFHSILPRGILSYHLPTL